MISMATITPYLFAGIIGFFIVRLISSCEKNFPRTLQLIFAAGIGIGVCADITFLSFILFDQLSSFFCLLTALTLAILLGFFYFKKYPFSLNKINGDKKHFISVAWPIALILLLSFPLIQRAQYYAHGGWDAWSVWNVKAKFLFLGGQNWDNMLQPMMWRSSPHYPLLLPLINVWGWIFTQAPVYYIPQLTAIFFSFLTAWLLYASVKDLTGSKFSLIPVILLISSPFMVLQCISQYCDLIFGFYLLAGVYCMIKTAQEDSPSFACLTGIFLGLVTFTKGEGLLAAGLLGMLSVPYFWIYCSNKKRLDILAAFLLCAFFAATPMLYFKFVYAPNNQTFTNGLTSQINPSTWPRMKAIFMYYFYELIKPKWNGLLLVILATLLFHFRALLKKEKAILTLFLFAYFAIVTFYYFVNTQFEIIWWLNVTWERVIFAVMPVILLLTFLTLLKNKNA